MLKSIAKTMANQILPPRLLNIFLPLFLTKSRVMAESETTIELKFHIFYNQIEL